MERSIWIGFDPRESAAYAVLRDSIRRHTRVPIPINGIVLDDMREAGLYTRPTRRDGAQLWDVISDAPMATEFSISRFLTPHLAGTGWALFMDCDMLALGSLARVFDLCDDSKAVMCVKHVHEPSNLTKMDGQQQTRYARKNWSSFMLFNCDHPANERLTLDLINTAPGRDLHAFCWLNDADIGELPPEWNYLVGHTRLDVRPTVVHFTEGMPFMPGYGECEFAEEWFGELYSWAA